MFCTKFNPHPVCSLLRTSECEYIPSSMGTASTPYWMEIKSLFCSQQDNYKVLIRSTYDEYLGVYNTITRKHPNVRGGLMTVEEHNALSEEARKDLHDATAEQKKIMKELVDLMRVYCGKYPDEKICKFPNWVTYQKYPYRLDQTLPEFIQRL